MNFGFTLPMRGPLSAPESLAAIAKRGDELGFGLLACSDHVVFPTATNSPFPYGTSSVSGSGPGDHLELVTTLGWLAAHTVHARLLTAVMVVPHRPAVLTAKALATVDHLSGGRLVVGAGAGWLREEFEALGAPPFDHRGSVTDEYIRAFRELWRNENPSSDGTYTSFHNIKLAPKPVQPGGPPIWVGGESPAAVRRAGRLGDGWYPIGSNPTYPLRTAQQMSAAMAQVRRHAEEAGRDPAVLDFGLQATWYRLGERVTGDDGARMTLTGAAEDIAGDIRAFQDIGVRHLVVGLVGQTQAESIERIERFMDAFGRA